MPRTVRIVDQEFELHPSREGVSEELLLFGVHEPLATEHYLRMLSPGDHVLDVGANLGYFLLTALSAIGTSGRALCFEPAPKVYDILQRNIKLSGRGNVQAFPWAIGSANTTAELYESEVPNWGSLIHNSNLRPTHATLVLVRTLDEVVREFPGFHPTVLRMDLEGGELAVLTGAEEVLLHYKPCLFVEFHPFITGWEATRDALLHLQTLGYSRGVLIERSWDHPWMSGWMRRRRCWQGSMVRLLERIECSSDPLTNSTFSVILRAVK
jgi:FkbM family methyltransferase